MTLGEDRIRTKFNPSGNELVNVIKKRAAELIDLLEAEKPHAGTEKVRLLALAQTSLEDGAMWAVKALT